MKYLTQKQYKELLKEAVPPERQKEMFEILIKEHLYDIEHGYISEDEPTPYFMKNRGS